MKTKVLALVLACLMLLSVPAFAATFTDVPETHDRYQAIDMLSSMEIINGFPDGSFKPDEAVTRAQMAALITRMFNLGGSAVTAEPFSDVTIAYWAASDIVSAKNRGIINGFPDGTFQPEAEVTYEQAVKMIVCALNYGAAAEAAGGYPNGYIQQASKLGILKNAASAQNQGAPRGIIAQLLYNSLNVDMLVPQINADGTVDYVKSEGGNNTVSQQFLKTETLKGVTVVRTPKVNLEPGVPAIASVNDNAMYVKKQDNSYVKITVVNNSAFDFIGHVVDITYKVDAEDAELKTLTNITRSTSVRAYENIKLTDVITLDASGLNYYINKADAREGSINFSGTPVVIYNERLHDNGIAVVNADLSGSNHEYANGVISVYVAGNQTLIKVKSYKNYVVESVDAINQKIIVKGASGNVSLDVPYKDSYVNETVIKKGTFNFGTGAAVANASKLNGYSGIAKGNIIAFASNTEDSSNQYFEVLVSGTALNGTIVGIETDDETGRSMIQVGNSNSTRLSRDLARYGQSATAQIELTAKFHVDPFGEIGYISNEKTQDIKLGIPVAVTTGGTGFDKITQLEIYNVDTNQVETLRFRDEVAGDPRVAVLKENIGTDSDPVYQLITDSLFKYTIKNGQIYTMEALVAGGANDAYTYDASKSVVTEVNDIEKVSSKIKFDGSGDPDNDDRRSITYNSGAAKIILIGSHYDSGKVTPKTTTLATNSKYTGKVYQLNNKKSGTNYNLQYIIVRPLEGLTKDSDTYIVDSVGGTILQGDTNVVTIKAYPFTGASKSGNGGALEEIVLTAPVATALNLQKGDVFTYYDVPSTVADIETLRNVYILARAKDIANGTYPTAGALAANNHMDVSNSHNPGTGYNADYNYFGIKNNSSNIAVATDSSVYAYYLGTPLAYTTDDDGVLRDLRMAKDHTSKLPVMANDTAAITALEGDMDDSLDYFFEYDLSQLVNIYVYDDAATLDADKLIQVKGKDQVRSYLEGLRTIENNKSNPAADKRHDTLMVKVFNSSANTFYNLYIIKDAR